MSDNKVTAQTSSEQADVVLIGAGVMSATLGTLLKQLQPDWTQVLFERLDIPAAESSSPWNNAGTGHSALCELNYTPDKNGVVQTAKAIDVNEKFQVSRQWWANAVDQGILPDPKAFIRPVPHVAFVTGTQNVDYLRRRFEALRGETLFQDLIYTEDETAFAEKLPLMAEGRTYNDPLAISYIDEGTDLNYGSLATQLLTYLDAQGTELNYGHEVKNLKKQANGSWNVVVKNRHTGDTRVVNAKFVFVGAGGGALPLLQKSGIAEARGFGGFPVSGEWLRCTNPEIIDRHAAKVYTQASVGAPPMSVPHLDTRVIDGEKGLLFGPYAGWTPKFLKNGRNTDLFASLRPHNLPSMVGVGLQEFGLTKYLITEVLKNEESKLEALRDFMPTAQLEDWELVTAGQRVQVIKPTGDKRFGSLEFGTAVLSDADGSLAGLLGASPGASISVRAMIDVIERCFGKQMGDWSGKLKEMIPSYGVRLSDDKALFDQVWDHSQKSLQLG